MPHTLKTDSDAGAGFDRALFGRNLHSYHEAGKAVQKGSCAFLLDAWANHSQSLPAAQLVITVLGDFSVAFATIFISATHHGFPASVIYF